MTQGDDSQNHEPAGSHADETVTAADSAAADGDQTAGDGFGADSTFVPADVRDPEAGSEPEPVPDRAPAADTESDWSIPAGEVESTVLTQVREYYDSADASSLPAPSEAFIERSFFDFSYLDEYTEIEHYWVDRPHAFVSILYDDERREYTYHVVESELDDFESYVRSDLEGVLRDVLLYQTLDTDADRRAVFDRRITDLLSEYADGVDAGSLRKIKYYLTRDFVGQAEVEPILRDRDVEDISCVGPNLPVFVYHRNYRDLETNVQFSEDRLNTFVTRIAQRSGEHISVAQPLLDGSMPDGSRVQLTLGTDVSTRGSNFTIRKFADVPYTPVDLVRWGTLSAEMVAYLWLAIQNGMSVLFAGGTASGKTTTMNATSFFIPPNSKVVSIEDTREITLPHDNWIQSVSREGRSGDDRGAIGMYKLLQAGLRQRPEYILVGEIRTEPDVALTFFQSISTGHTGYSTFHADSVRTTIDRLTTPPLSVPESMVRSLDVVVVQRQAFLGSKRVRRAVALTEIAGDAESGVTATPVFEWNADGDTFEQPNQPAAFERIRKLRGWGEQRLQAEFETRVSLIEHLVETGVTDHEVVVAVLNAFARDPETVTHELETGDFDPNDYA